MTTNRKILVHVVLLGLLILLTYSNSFHVPFQFDDRGRIKDNTAIHSLENFTYPPDAQTESQYRSIASRYVGMLSLALNYKLHGTKVTGYHVVNLGIHTINTLIVYLLVILTFRTPLLRNSSLHGKSHFIAFCAAALFATHPVQTQAVTYIIQRLASLATLFYLCSLACYIRSRLSDTRRAKILFYTVAMVSALLAMKSKEIAITLPLSVIMYEFFFFHGTVKKRAVILFPILLTALVIPLTIFDLNTQEDALSPTSTMEEIENATRVRNVTTPRIDYLMTESRVLMTYLRLILFPVNQNIRYDYPVYTSFATPNVLLSTIFLGGLLIAAAYLSFGPPRKKEPALRLVGMGIFWFFITLSVESTLIPLHPIYEHRLYLPLAGIAIGGATAIFFVIDTLKTRRARNAVIGVCMVAPLLFAAASFNRNTDWKSAESLWLDVLHKSPGNFRALYGLGSFYIGNDQAEKALPYLLEATRRYPRSGPVHDLLGLTYDNLGEEQKALEHHQQAVKLAPDLESPYSNLGNYYLNHGKYREAVEIYQKLLNNAPRSSQAHFSIGLAFKELGDTEQAIRHYQEAIELDPGFSDAYTNLGNVLAMAGRLTESISAFKKAIVLDPDSSEARFNLANSYMRQEQFEPAEEELTRLLQMEPRNTEARFTLGLARLSTGQYERAHESFTTVIRTNPDYDRAYLALAAAYQRQGQKKKAEEILRALLKRMPEHPLALQALKQLR